MSTSGLSKEADSGVLTNFEYSRAGSTLRAKNWLRPCWTTFFNQPRVLPISYVSGFICS